MTNIFTLIGAVALYFGFACCFMACSSVRINCTKRLSGYSTDETCSVDVNRNGRTVRSDEGKNINSILEGMGKPVTNEIHLEKVDK